MEDNHSINNESMSMDVSLESLSHPQQQEQHEENDVENSFCYESDYVYPDDDDDGGGSIHSDQENRKMASTHNAKTIMEIELEADQSGKSFGNHIIDYLPSPSFVPSVASLNATAAVLTDEVVSKQKKSFNHKINSCDVCANVEDHTPVVDCSMIQNWNRLVEDFQNGILDVPPHLIAHAMQHRIEECYMFVHNTLRREDGWPAPRQPGVSASLVTTTVDRADRFFAHKTREVVAADLRARRWNFRAWRTAMLTRRGLEIEWEAATTNLLQAANGSPLTGHRADLLGIERRIAQLGLDPMMMLTEEHESLSVGNVTATYSSTVAVSRHHERSMKRTKKKSARHNNNNHVNENAGPRGNSNNDLNKGSDIVPASVPVPMYCQDVAVPADANVVRQPPATPMIDGMFCGSTKLQDLAWTCPICFDELQPQDGICVRIVSSYGTNEHQTYEFCGHFYCRDCWMKYIHASLQEVRGTGGGELINRLYCPHPRCFAQVTRSHIERVVEGNTPVADFKPNNLHPLLMLHDDLALNSFVRGHKSTMCWCAGPDCQMVMLRCGAGVFVSRRAQAATVGNGCFTVCGTCKERFCFHCGSAREEHNPRGGTLLCPEIIPQGYATQMTVANRDYQNIQAGCPQQVLEAVDAIVPCDMFDSTKSNHMIQLCPGCKIPIEKTGGCAHMRCKCGHHFCWLCMADLTQDFQHFCGRERGRGQNHHGRVRLILPRIDVDYLVSILHRDQELSEDFGSAYQTMLQKQKNLTRFAHYYNRFIFHNQGQHFAENQCECVAHRASDYLQMSKIGSAADTDFFSIANARLVTSRRLLKYSYCILFYRLKQVPVAEDSQEPRPEDVEDSGCPSDDAMSASLPISLALFLDHQERLERVTERLSFLSESALTPKDRQKVIEMIGTVEKCMKVLSDLSFEQDGQSVKRFRT